MHKMLISGAKWCTDTPVTEKGIFNSESYTQIGKLLLNKQIKHSVPWLKARQGM